MEKDPYLSQKIISTELPGVFNKILDGMKRLLSQRNFSPSPIIDDELKKYRKESSSILSFLDDENYVISCKSKIPSETFHHIYKEYCLRNGFNAFAVKKFNAQLRSIGYKIERGTNGYYHINVEKLIPGFEDLSNFVNINV